MIRDEFERLLSDWLDEPLRADLREVIENAAADNPELATIRDEWRRVHALTWDKPVELGRIDWKKSVQTISARIDADITNAEKRDELDSILKLAIAPVELRVDWKRFAGRVGEAIDANVDAELSFGNLDSALLTQPSGVVWEQERERIAAATHTIKLTQPKRLRAIRLVGWASGLATAAVIGWLYFRSPDLQIDDHSMMAANDTRPVISTIAEVAIESLEQSVIDDEATVVVAMVDPGDDSGPNETNEGQVAASVDDFYFSISPARSAAGM